MILVMATLSQKDIAQLAGVDQSAVSHALRGTGTLSQETRQRILDICREHHYRPNAHARSLRTADSRLIGVVTGRLTETYHAQLIHALTLALMPHGYHLMLRYCHRQADHAVRQNQILSLLDRQAAGVVIATYSHDLKDEIQQLAQAGVPLVMLGFATGGVPSVAIDRFAAGKRVGQHLIAIGCQRPMTLMNPRKNIEEHRDKWFGFEQAFEDAGRPAPRRHPLDSTQDPHAAGYQAGREMLHASPLPDGIFCESDDVALGLMRALLEQGIRIPEQIALVGFDDTPNALCGPLPLSSVHQPIAALADQAVSILLGKIHKANPNVIQPSQDEDADGSSASSTSLTDDGHPTLLPPRLIIRASSKRG